LRIPTKDADGNPNGYVLPLWNAITDPISRPDQVYLTAVAPHSMKGPHLHKVRRGLFFCIKGRVRIVVRAGNQYMTFQCSDTAPDVERVHVPAGWAAALYNDGAEEALVLNMPAPAWSKDAPDEWPVENWNPPSA
jgi:dTDP-4-dehydrorhamnose 3,5-epimerase-like enzyme